MYTRKIKTNNISIIFFIISIISIIFTSLSVSYLSVINHSYTFSFVVRIAELTIRKI